jgi:hypothetical protein
MKARAGSLQGIEMNRGLLPAFPLDTHKASSRGSTVVFHRAWCWPVMRAPSRRLGTAYASTLAGMTSVVPWLCEDSLFFLDAGVLARALDKQLCGVPRARVRRDMVLGWVSGGIVAW